MLGLSDFDVVCYSDWLEESSPMMMFHSGEKAEQKPGALNEHKSASDRAAEERKKAAASSATTTQRSDLSRGMTDQSEHDDLSPTAQALK